MVRIKRSYRIQVCGARSAPMASSPRILNRPTGTDQTPRYAKSRLAVHHRSTCSGVKALPNTSPARRQAAKLCYRFGPLTPSARSANLIAGDGTKNGFPASNKEPATNQKHDLTGKAPYRFESGSLHRRVHCEPDSLIGCRTRIVARDYLPHSESCDATRRSLSSTSHRPRLQRAASRADR
jgi:hypothetical protein